MRHRVKMLKTTFAAEDGIHAKHYMKGRSYEISDYLMETFISMGVIEMDAPNYNDAFQSKDIVPGVRGRPRK